MYSLGEVQCKYRRYDTIQTKFDKLIWSISEIIYYINGQGSGIRYNCVNFETGRQAFFLEADIDKVINDTSEKKA